MQRYTRYSQNELYSLAVEREAEKRLENEQLQKRIEELDRQLHEVMGWMYAYACTCVDENVDIRTIEAPEIIEECLQTIRHKAREGK